MLVVLSVHCLIGGGQTPILAAGFTTISQQFGVSLSKMSYTTGVYMLFLGLGSVVAAPTALLYGKRPGRPSLHLFLNRPEIDEQSICWASSSSW